VCQPPCSSSNKPSELLCGVIAGLYCCGKRPLPTRQSGKLCLQLL
jgi:hypothetical protein